MQKFIDNTLLVSHPNSPYTQATSNGVFRRGYIQQHGFVTPNSMFNEYLDRGKARNYTPYQRDLLSQQLQLSNHQPSSHLDRELLVAFGALQTHYNTMPNLARVPSNIVREGTVKYEPPPVPITEMDVDKTRKRILEIIQGDEKAVFM